uniref:EGF-like domain-containing protein n=1 Tax=Leersia perrieri TaxID=77586 RepID=A0A0D9XGT4_9ORYZ
MKLMTVWAVAALLVLQLIISSAGGGGPPAPPWCPDRCGEVSVPYPFGIRDGCSLEGFGLTCDNTTDPPRLMVGNGTLQVVEISLANSTLRAVDLAGAVNITYDSSTRGPDGNGTWASLGGGGDGPYVVSEQHNQLVVTGCNVQAMLSTNLITGCSSFCPVSEMFRSVASITNLECSGTNCCETSIAIGRPSYVVQFRYRDPDHEHDGKLSINVRIAERGWFDGVAARMLDKEAEVATARTPVPVVLEWALASTRERVLWSSEPPLTNWSCAAATACLSSDSLCVNVTGNYRSGHVCRCRDGYDGNPYVTGGCQDIDECKIAGKCFGECTNTDGAFLCRCPRGARGNASIPNGCVKTNLGLSVGIGVGSGAGLLVMALCAVFLTRHIKKRRAKMLRHKFFKQNRGHLLQQLASQNAEIAERMVINLYLVLQQVRGARGTH